MSLMPVIAGGSCYLTMRTLAFLCSRPPQGRELGRLDLLHERFANLKEQFAQAIGDKNWTYLKEVVAPNSWVSLSVLVWMNQPSEKPSNCEKVPAFYEKVAAFSVCFFCIASLSWTVRSCLAKLQERGEASSSLPPERIDQVTEIPSALQDDPIFRRFICSITCEPIRYPVRDPNGVTLYERSAIQRWIEQRHTSPVTRKPLNEQQLEPQPARQALIDSRLRYWYFQAPRRIIV